MTPWEALLLGLGQGFTEFLPVSSSGHLVLGETLLGVNPPGVVFEVAVHLATAVAILGYYRRRILIVAAGAMRRQKDSWAFVGKIALASVPVAVVGFVFEDAIAGAFDSPALVAPLLGVTGAVLWSTRRLSSRGSERRSDLISWSSALWIGSAQALALLPGISRSGMTVVAALWCGAAPKVAAEFSFLLALPAILGASVLQAPRVVSGGAGLSLGSIAAGFTAAALSGFLALILLVRWLERGRLHQFSYYLWAVAAVFLAYWTLR